MRKRGPAKGFSKFWVFRFARDKPQDFQKFGFFGSLRVRDRVAFKRPPLGGQGTKPPSTCWVVRPARDQPKDFQNVGFFGLPGTGHKIFKIVGFSGRLGSATKSRLSALRQEANRQNRLREEARTSQRIFKIFAFSVCQGQATGFSDLWVLGSLSVRDEDAFKRPPLGGQVIKPPP